MKYKSGSLKISERQWINNQKKRFQHYFGKSISIEIIADHVLPDDEQEMEMVLNQCLQKHNGKKEHISSDRLDRWDRVNERAAVLDFARICFYRQWNHSKAAQLLGIHRTPLRNFIKKILYANSN